MVIGQCEENTVGARAEAMKAQAEGKLRRVSTGLYETPQTGVEYYSSDQKDGILGTVYRQYVAQIGCAGGSTATINFIAAITGIVVDYEYLVDLGSGWIEKLPYNHRTDANWSVELRVYNTGFWIECGANNSCGTTGLAWVDYTKA